MKKITYGLLWFLVLLMNVGLAVGTIGLVLLLKNYSPLTEYGLIGITAGLSYTFFYVLLVVGVIGINLHVKEKGIKHLLSELNKDAEL